MKIYFILISSIFVILLCLDCNGQRAKVEIDEFLVDGRVIDCNYNLTIFADKKRFKPRFVGNTFEVPQQLRKARNIAVKLQCGAYTISINSLGKRDFFAPNNGRYIWSGGIDSYPFDEADVPSEIADKVAEVHYIRFLPYDYVGTKIQLFIPKKMEKNR